VNEPQPAGLRLSEAVIGGFATVVALTAWASLALAHAGRHSGAAVGTAMTIASLLVVGVTWRTSRRVQLVRDPRTLALLLIAGVGIAVMFLPGWRYTVGDKDPGGYISHAVSIAHTGDAVVPDPLRERVARVALSGPGARFPGVWIRSSDGKTVPQFFHLWPALLASAYDGFGDRGLSDLGPALGVLSVLVLVVAVRRAAGGVAAAVTAVLLPTNMLQVWQAKYPTTEMLAQLLVAGALLGIVLAVSLRWQPAAAAAGLFLGIGWLARADGLVLVGLALLVGCVLWATSRWDRRCTAFALGLLVVVPHAAWQAWWYARYYNLINGIPTGSTVMLAAAGLIVVALAARPLLRGRAAGRVSDRRTRQIGVAVVCAVAGGVALGFLRPRLFGPAYQDFHGPRVRSYDEQTFRRLSWFLTLPGLALFVAGVGVVALRRWSAALWSLVLPGLLVMPVYCYSSHNSSRLMWWGRRFVPLVLPTIVVLLALAVAYGLRQRLLRPVAALLLVFLAATFLHQSLPLRHHDEYGGAHAVVSEVADVSRGGVLLWQPGRCCTSATRLFAIPVWLDGGVVGSPIPTDPAFRPDYVQQVLVAFAGRPVFVAWAGSAPPEGLGAVRVTPERHLVTDLPVWQESDTTRPDHATSVHVDFTIWRVARP
jgi:hypothetical protein